MKAWKKVSSKIVHKNPYYQVREDVVIRPDGNKGLYFVTDLPLAVVTVPLTKDKEIYLIKINRYATGTTLWELPFGSSENQDKLFAAKRELQEETGLVADSWEELGEHQLASGWCSQIISIFLAQNVRETKKEDPGEEGITQKQKFSLSEIFEMIKSGEIVDGNSIAAITLAALKLNLV